MELIPSCFKNRIIHDIGLYKLCGHSVGILFIKACGTRMNDCA
jgi:hypothetical protein